MIQYALKCAEGHQFDSWFQSAAAFEKLQSAGHLACGVCGSNAVEKSLMAPRVASKSKSAPEPEQAPTSTAPTDFEKAVAALKEHVEKNSDYVGKDFVRQARDMHLGDAPERPIWGEAKPDEAKKLIEDGINVAPLPFVPTRKSN